MRRRIVIELDRVCFDTWSMKCQHPPNSHLGHKISWPFTQSFYELKGHECFSGPPLTHFSIKSDEIFSDAIPSHRQSLNADIFSFSPHFFFPPPYFLSFLLFKIRRKILSSLVWREKLQSSEKTLNTHLEPFSDLSGSRPHTNTTNNKSKKIFSVFSLKLISCRGENALFVSFRTEYEKRREENLIHGRWIKTCH